LEHKELKIENTHYNHKLLNLISNIGLHMMEDRDSNDYMAEKLNI